MSELKFEKVVVKKKKEVVHGTPENPRTMWYPGAYNDSQIDWGPNLTDASGYVPTDELIGRFLRGEPVQGSANKMIYDVEDIRKIKDKNEIFEAENPTNVPGFELGDIADLKAKSKRISKDVRRIKAERLKKKELEKAQNTSENLDSPDDSGTPESDGKAAEQPPVLGKDRK